MLQKHRILRTNASVLKVGHVAIKNLSKRWAMPIRNWKQALNYFAIEFEDLFPA